MSKKALSINFPIERAILSDFLPFEVPITFSNRHYYNFLLKYKVKHDGMNFIWIKVDDGLNAIILILLGLEQSTLLNEVEINGIKYIKTNISGYGHLPSMAFTFPIHHKHNEFRYLSIIHPKGQLLGVDFYDKFKDLITYYSDLSPVSLRSAKKVAGCTYIDSKSMIESSDDSELGIELDGQNYENLKSFFVYKKYRNIFEFYESDDHHWCEKRFNFLSKLDVSHCFDSIYTHSISWAILQKTYAKQNLNSTKFTFAYKFDQLMQRINYNETNGIIIGPELSRIFAEIIMQSIDNEVLNDLSNDGVILEKDYQIYRYVDDYFVFYNDNVIYEKIRSILQKKLKNYKLGLNRHKEETYSRPIITPITIAKKKIADLISEKLKYKIDSKDELDVYNIYIHQSSLSTDFKSILSDSGVTYSDILNYALAVIEKKMAKIFTQFKDVPEGESKDRQLINALVSVINFSYFIYSVSPKVNSTIKLCRIIQRIIVFIKNNKIGIEYQHIVFKCIFDNSCSILDKCSISKATPIETLYLLVLLRQLGKYYWLDESTLVKYFNIQSSEDGYIFDDNLNYFSLTSIIFYISNKKRYQAVKSSILKHIECLYDSRTDDLLGDSELVHLTLDLLSCPYIDLSFKNRLLKKYGVEKQLTRSMISKNKFWFTKWNNFDFTKELDAKISKDVY
ncbi:RNA-directed DNA polymerase [Vibrio fluvialis]|nr:RNA-directed DNA polymerase [Vibrio fluvialis]